ncbi:MAG: hypothetical protein FWE90_09990 [Defluviitaleaceae bacterium]|nr:hypothetical protein [Defluviitaleaceae bacterium]
MTLSNYIKMLYPIIGGEQKVSEFVVCLVDHIMEMPYTKNNKQLLAEDKYNPLAGKGPSTLEKIYNSHGELSKKDARLIRSRINKERFCEFLSSSCSNDAIEMIEQALQNTNVEIIENDVLETCTDLFVTIINNIANKQRKSSSSNTNDVAVASNETITSYRTSTQEKPSATIPGSDDFTAFEFLVSKSSLLQNAAQMLNIKRKRKE